MTRAQDPTRTRLVEAAAEAFAADGIEAVSLESVAAAAGVHRTTLHRHFPGGRDELVMAVLDREADALATRMAELIDAAPSAADALVACTAHAVVEGRRSRVAAALLAEPGARSALLGPALGRVRETGVAVWEAVRAKPGGRDATTAPSADRVVGHIFRVIVSLVEQPDDVATPAQVRAYVRDFVCPALVDPT